MEYIQYGSSLCLRGESILSCNNLPLVSNGSNTTLRPKRSVVTTNMIRGSVWWQPLPIPAAIKGQTMPTILPSVIATPTPVALKLERYTYKNPQNFLLILRKNGNIKILMI